MKPGGRALILDSDESVFALHPEPQDLRPFIEETQALQRANGGDRFVGGKLGWYMRAAGFEDVEPQMFVMTPEMMGRETFLDIVLRFRPILFPAERRDEATATMERLHAIARDTMVYGHNGSSWPGRQTSRLSRGAGQGRGRGRGRGVPRLLHPAARRCKTGARAGRRAGRGAPFFATETGEHQAWRA